MRKKLILILGIVLSFSAVTPASAEITITGGRIETSNGNKAAEFMRDIGCSRAVFRNGGFDIDMC